VYLVRTRRRWRASRKNQAIQTPFSNRPHLAFDNHIGCFKRDVDNLNAFGPEYGVKQFCEQEYDAVRAAIVLPWSNGQIEGQIHRLKLLKRQMYGRANLDLLRIRLIRHPIGTTFEHEPILGKVYPMNRQVNCA
jgi:hypothetical protein